MAVLLALPASRDLLRDPEGTLDRLRGATLRVAVVAPALTPNEAVAQLGVREPDGLRVTAVVGAIPRSTPLPWKQPSPGRSGASAL